MVKILKKIMLAILLAYASLFAILTPAFAQVPEGTTIDVTVSDEGSLVVIDNTTDIIEFTLNLTDEDQIILSIAEFLNASAEEVAEVILFNEEEPPINPEVISIEVLIRTAQNISEVTILENDTQTDNFSLNLTDENEIILELSSRLNLTEEEVTEVISFEIDNESLNTLENTQIRVLINENLNVTEVTVFENSTQIDVFTLNTTVAEEIIDGIALRLNADKNDVIEAIVNEIIVDTTVGEWTLFVFFDRFLKLYNVVEDNMNGENPFPPNMDVNSGRILSEDVDFSNMSSEIQVAVDSEKWVMFKFFRMFANSDDGLMFLLTRE